MSLSRKGPRFIPRRRRTSDCNPACGDAPSPTSGLDSGTPVIRFLQIKITLRGSDPPVWRRVAIRSDVPLPVLHDVIQVVMGWDHAHLFEFRKGGRRYAPPIEDDDLEAGEDAGRFILSDVAPAVRSKIEYLYDFGDSWSHELVIEKVLPPDPKVPFVNCLEGSGACPPEDCGGLLGYAALLEAHEDKTHPDHGEAVAMLGRRFKPEAFDPRPVNKVLKTRYKQRVGRASGVDHHGVCVKLPAGSPALDPSGGF